MAFASIPAAFAQATPPPAASALQQNQNQLQQLNQENAAPKAQGNVVETAPVQRAGLPPPGGPKVLVKTVTFEPPSTFLSAAELNAIAAKYVGRRLDFSQISALVRDVNDLYAKKGIVTASAILPPQQLNSGNLKVQLVEGKLGNVTISGTHRTKDKYILDRVRLDTNGVVDVPKAAKDITWFNKTNQAQLRLRLQPGASFGLTDLDLAITEPVPTTLQFFVDNEGVPSTGELEYGVYFRAYDQLGIDDDFTLYATDSGGALAGTVSYDAPISTSGTRLAASYTRSNITVVNGPTAPLDITGRSQAGSLTVTQPIIANDDWTVLASLAGSLGTSISDASAVPLVDTVTRKGALGVSVSYSKDGNAFNFSPQAIYANSQDNLAGTSADIWLAAGSASASLALTQQLSLVAQGAFQYTGTKLLPGDLLFQIGGASTVRGYQADAVAGDSGYFGQVELHRQLDGVMPGLDIYAFTDFGQVFSTFPAQTTLASVGAGLSWNIQDKATADISFGVPVVHALADQPAAAIYARFVAHAF
ncbi:MAG TPA: ShlB/FhaC/HecB family hemolysin secretion/activation protein [Devosia sp.]|nr:ShlB/FhaC/HecB family hemolysin secretion/activation protein [Devosia sp.]